MLAGPMDYTPGAFNNVTEDGFVARDENPTVMGTRAQQLALYVVYETPFQMVSDSPQAYRGHLGFEFIKEVPTAWDETRVIAGRPGEFATIARRNGNNWYVGSMNNWSGRDVTVPLTFLSDGDYKAEIYADAADAAIEPKHLEISHKAVRRSDTLTFHLAPGGGAAIRLQHN
jgi:alpha-glucosidase